MSCRNGWKPTFIGIGAQKSATTWCAEMLRQHPDVCFSQPKELNFFNDNLHRGQSWYAQHFVEPTRPVQGEITPLYMDHPEVAGRIAERFPDVKILVVLRHPHDRAISNLLHELRSTDGKLAAANAERVRKLARQDDRHIRRSCYASALALYFRYFPPSQIQVLFYEDFVSDNRSFLRALYSCVGASDQFVPPDYERMVNKSEDFVSPTLFKALRAVSQAAKRWAPTRRGMHWLYRNTRLRERVLSGLSVDRGRPKLDFHEVFGVQAVQRIAQDVQRLESELQITIPATWPQRASPTLEPRSAA